MTLTLVTTTAGRAQIPAGVTIAQVGVSATNFAPTSATTALPGELKRLSTIAGIALAPDQLHLTILDDSGDAYGLKSFALYLSDGTLFAAYSQATAILTKTAASSMILAVDIGFTDLDATLITFGETSFALPPATETTYGLVKLASLAEAIAGAPPASVVTAADMAAIIATLTEALANNPHNTQLGEGKWLHRAMAENEYYKFPNGQHLPLPEYQDMADALAGDAFLAANAADKAANKGKWFISDDGTYLAMPDHRGDFLRIDPADMAPGGVTRPTLAHFKANQNLAHDHELPSRGANTASENKLSGGNGTPEVDGEIDTLPAGGDEAVPDHVAVGYYIRVL